MDVVHTRNIDLRGALPHRGDQLHGRGVQTQFIARAVSRIHRSVQAEFMRWHATRLRTLTPDGCVFIIRWEHHRATGHHAVDHIGVLLRYGFDGLHEFLVLALCIVDDRHGRCGNRRQLCGFSRMIHTQLDDRRTVRGIQIQQSQWQANVVVQIATSRQIVIRKGRLHDRCEHFLDRGFAIATGHHRQRQIKLRAPVLCQIL